MQGKLVVQLSLPRPLKSVFKTESKSQFLCLFSLERIRVSINTWKMTLTAAPSLAPAHGNALQLLLKEEGEKPPFPQFKKREIHHWPFGPAGWLHGTWWGKEAAGESREQGAHGKDVEQGCEGGRGDGNCRYWEKNQVKIRFSCIFRLVATCSCSAKEKYISERKDPRLALICIRRKG